MCKIDMNFWNTTDLVLSVMARVADRLGLNIEDDQVSDQLYNICCDLESFPEDEGFGTSDMYSYITRAKREFNIE